MNIHQQKTIITLGLFLAVCVALSLMISSSPQTMAQGPGLPTPTTGPTITPMPTATNAPVATSAPSEGSNGSATDSASARIAYIQLNIPATFSGGLSVV